jgi:ankyrin repeat protein
MNGHLNIVKYLYKKIYDPKIYDVRYHQDLFEIAASRNHINIFKYLYDIFPDKDEIETDFIYNDAIGNANLELVKFFVENNIKFSDFERFSVNITLEHIPMMKYLIENGWTLSTDFRES